jgi:hypothetical protein
MGGVEVWLWYNTMLWYSIVLNPSFFYFTTTVDVVKLFCIQVTSTVSILSYYFVFKLRLQYTYCPKLRLQCPYCPTVSILSVRLQCPYCPTLGLQSCESIFVVINSREFLFQEEWKRGVVSWSSLEHYHHLLLSLTQSPSIPEFDSWKCKTVTCLCHRAPPRMYKYSELSKPQVCKPGLLRCAYLHMCSSFPTIRRRVGIG